MPDKSILFKGNSNPVIEQAANDLKNLSEVRMNSLGPGRWNLHSVDVVAMGC
jgi:hypothetical protein